MPLAKIPSFHAGGYKTRFTSDKLEDASILKSTRDYLKVTWSPKNLYKGSQIMFDKLFAMLDKNLPFNEWLEKKYGMDKSGAFAVEVIALAAILTGGVVLLPSWILSGAMLFGIGTSLADYGNGLYHYQSAQFTKDLENQKKSIETGQESSFAFLLGASFIGLSQGLPLLANSRLLKLPAGAAQRLKSVAQGACLFDDPVHLGNAGRKLPLSR